MQSINDIVLFEIHFIDKVLSSPCNFLSYFYIQIYKYLLFSDFGRRRQNPVSQPPTGKNPALIDAPAGA